MPDPVKSERNVLEDRLGKTADRASALPSRPATPYDTLPEESFDRVARLAAGSLRAPVAIVSLLDEDRHVVKSSIGLTGRSRVWRKVPLALRFSRQVASTGRPVFVGNTDEKVAAIYSTW